MANNFKILSHRTGDNLNLHLAGDFDGSSAFELLNLLDENLDDTAHVSIDTSNLKKIHAFGRKVFRHNLFRLRIDQSRIRFVGENARDIASTEIRYS